jgi:nitroimidazol reductase NimA-like FMN-containing flavoprotein (pyridoxamine 5'-phosphate oxidase superfamily)
MRRSDREVTDINEIADILCRADTIRLGLHDDPYPYIVPLSFGFELEGGKFTVYFHGAKEGLKHELIKQNPRVCVEADIFHRYVDFPERGSITTEYESVIGFGRIERITGDEATKGIDLLLKHCGYAGFIYDQAMMDAIWVYKVELFSVTGKRRFVNG